MQIVLCLDSTTKRILSILKFQMNFKLENKHEGNFFNLRKLHVGNFLEKLPPTHCKINTLYPKLSFIKTHVNNAIKKYLTAIEINNFPCGN